MRRPIRIAPRWRHHIAASVVELWGPATVASLVTACCAVSVICGECLGMCLRITVASYNASHWLALST